jgi:4-hydroxybutyryl-CoA dehydratase/vinylacetyl-CoA-Delta-isomerase
LIARLIGYLTESMHGAGSPQAQRIQIARVVDIEAKKALAFLLAGVEKARRMPDRHS